METRYLHAWILILALIFDVFATTAHAQKVRIIRVDDNLVQDLVDNQEAERHSQEAIEHPEKFHEKILDITKLGPIGAMTLEMARFYFAVAAVEFTHCFRSSDSTACTNFLESLKEPAGHIGFMLFMKGNRMGMEAAQIISRGKISRGMGGYLGLTTGMLAQGFFEDLYFHPTVQELLKVNSIQNAKLREEKRRVIMNKLWGQFKGGLGQYLYDKIPHILGLLGTAYISHQTMKVARAGILEGEKFVKFASGAKNGQAVIHYGRDLKRSSSVVKGAFKFVLKGGKFLRINPVVLVGSHLVETVVFLLWAPVVEDFVVKTWKRGEALSKVNRALNGLDKFMLTSRPDLAKSKEYADQLEEGWDEFRETIFHSARVKNAQHNKIIGAIDQQFNRMMLYYDWLLKGMNYEHDYWVSNHGGFRDDRRVDSILESMDMAEAFFCGVSPADAVERKLAWKGIPIPSSYDFNYQPDDSISMYEQAQKHKGRFDPRGVELEAWQVVRIPGLCKSDYIKMNNNKWPGSYDKMNCPVLANWDKGTYEFGNFKRLEIECRLDQRYIRHRIFRTGRFLGKNIQDQYYDALDEATSKVLAKLTTVREYLIYAYERQLQSMSLHALTGQEITIKSNYVEIDGDVEVTSVFHGGRYPLGVIPHLEMTGAKWKKWRRLLPKAESILKAKVEGNDAKLKVANYLMEYNQRPFAERVREREFFDDPDTQDWKKVVRQYRDLIIY